MDEGIISKESNHYNNDEVRVSNKHEIIEYRESAHALNLKKFN